MALNYSHPTIFSAHLSEENLVSPFMIANSRLVEGVPERSGDGFVRPWHSAREMCDFFDCGGDRGGVLDSQESVSKDILDLLPADPFGMDMSSTFTAAITGLLEDFEADPGFGSAGVGTASGNYPLFAGWNLIWNSTLGFGSYHDNPNPVNASASAAGFSSYHGVSGEVCQMGDAFSLSRSTDYSGMTGGDRAVCSGNLKVEDEIRVLGDVLCGSISDAISNTEGASCSNASSSPTEGTYVDNVHPHNAFVFALGYLGVPDLLKVERVCKSLCCTVQNDPLLWRNIRIDQQLSERITDDILLQLTDRAQGKLQSLSLVECTKITDDGLRRVLERNLSLTKLSVPGCTRLSIDGVVSCLKAFNSVAVPGIKQLRIGGLYGMTESHFEDLRTLLGVDNETVANGCKPHFYRRGSFFLSVEDDRAIDIEVCPRCHNFRQLYDCPAEEHSGQACRACIICIPRCVDCGRCINDGEFEETFCLELLCSVCGEQSLDCHVKREMKVSPPAPNFPGASLSFQG